VVGALLFLAAIVLPLLRNGGVGTWDTIWIEDTVYTEEANRSGPFAVLLRGYAGYLQLVSRVLALPTTILPASWLSVYLAVAAATLCALGAAFVYRQTDGIVASVELRLVIAAMVVLSPAMAIETTATITNTIWTVLAVAPFAFISVRESRRDIVMRAVVAFLAATATALSALFLPLAIGYAVARRTRASIAVACSFGAGLVLQLLVVRVSPVAERAENSVRILVDLFGLRVLGSFLVGERPLDQLWTTVGEPVVVVLIVVVVALFAFLLRGAGRRNQIMAAVLLAYAGGAFVLPAWGRGTGATGFELGVYSLNMTRYTVGPILLLVTAAALLVDPALEPRERPIRFDARKVMVVWALLVLAIGFYYPTVRGAGPAWSTEYARVFAERCKGVASDDVVEVTTTPTTFTVELTCRRLAS
jgi:hypothetical protein